MKKYLLTPSLLNSWKYCVESDYSSLDDFLKTLRREKTEQKEVFIKGYDFEDYMKKHYPETLNGSYEVKVSRIVIIDGVEYVLYGRIDCLKAGIITDYKWTGSYENGKFYDSYQTMIYLDLVPEAYQMNYVISNNFNKDKVVGNWEEDKDKFNLFVEEYKREDLKLDVKQEIKLFMEWLKELNLLKIYKENWESKY